MFISISFSHYGGKTKLHTELLALSAFCCSLLQQPTPSRARDEFLCSKWSTITANRRHSELSYPPIQCMLLGLEKKNIPFPIGTVQTSRTTCKEINIRTSETPLKFKGNLSPLVHIETLSCRQKEQATIFCCIMIGCKIERSEYVCPG